MAALTGWYEPYFDLVSQGGGQFPFEIKRMHQVYGPIVRINPDELHVDDPKFYDVIYAANKLYDKPEKFQHRFSTPNATFSTCKSSKHKIRRAALSPFFSKTKICARSSQIQTLMNRISHRLSTEWAGKSKVLNIQDMWSCLTADTIMDIVFGRPQNLLEAPDFHNAFLTAVSATAVWCHITLHFGFLSTLLNSIPDWMGELLFPPFKPVFIFRRAMRRQVDDVLAGRNYGDTQEGQQTIFHALLASGIPRQELSSARLFQESQSLIGAGFETTSWVLTIGTFHIVNNPRVARRLKAELVQSIPLPEDILPWSELEKLPYLTAVIKETLRISYGDVKRMPRINPTGTWTYGPWVIPPGTPVGMDQYHMHMNKDIYGPSPETFLPERWLGDPKGPDGKTPLTHYLTTFGRGTRSCLGLQLAYAEMFIGLATLFRRHDLALFETTTRDVEFHHETFKAAPWHGSKGVRFLVT